MQKFFFQYLFRAAVLSIVSSFPAIAQAPMDSETGFTASVPKEEAAESEVSTDTIPVSEDVSDTSSILSKCEANLSIAVDQMILRSNELEEQIARAQSETDQCKAEIRDRASGATVLLRRAEVAEKRVLELEAKAITDDERTAYKAEIKDKEDRIDRLVARLDFLGITEVAQFSYMQNDPAGSLLAPNKLSSLSIENTVAPEYCEDALDWLQERTGDNKAFRVAAWTHSKIEGWQLCRFSTDTTGIETVEPIGSDKAHMLYFR